MITSPPCKHTCWTAWGDPRFQICAACYAVRYVGPLPPQRVKVARKPRRKEIER